MNALIRHQNKLKYIVFNYPYHVFGTFCVALLFVGSTLISNAITLAIVTTTGIVLVIYKLPKIFKKLLVKLSILVDLFVTFGTYCLLGRTTTALVASGLVGTLVSLYLVHLQQLFSKEKKEEGK